MTMLMMHNAHVNVFGTATIDEDEDESRLQDGNQSNGTTEEPKRLIETELSWVEDNNFVVTRLLKRNGEVYDKYSL